MACGLGICGATRCLAWPEVGLHVVREQRHDLVRQFPLRLDRSRLYESVNSDAKESHARLQREMEPIEHRLALAEQGGHLRHELVDHSLHLTGMRQWVVAYRPVLQDEQLQDVGRAER